MEPHVETPPVKSEVPLLDGIMNVQRFVAELVIVVMALITTAEVLCRAFLHFSLLVTEELGGYFLVALVFLGMGIALYDGKLFRVEFVMQVLSSKKRQVLQLFFNLLSLAFTVVLAWEMVGLVLDSYSRHVQAATTLATPEYMPQIVMAVGATTMALVLLSQCIAGARALFRSKA